MQPPKSPAPNAPFLTLHVLATESEATLRKQLTGPQSGPLVRLEVAHGSEHVRRFLPQPLARALATALRQRLRSQATAPWYVVAVQVASGRSLLVAGGQGPHANRSVRRRNRRSAPAQKATLQPTMGRGLSPMGLEKTADKPFGWLRGAALRPNDFHGPESPQAPEKRTDWHLEKPH